MEKFIWESLNQKVILKCLYQGSLKFIRKKHCLYIHQDYQHPEISLYPLDEISSK